MDEIKKGAIRRSYDADEENKTREELQAQIKSLLESWPVKKLVDDCKQRGFTAEATVVITIGLPGIGQTQIGFVVEWGTQNEH